MVQLPQNDDSIFSVPRTNHRLDEKGLVTELTVPTSLDGDTDAFASAQSPYRLYKRRWIGVFAMFLLEAVSSASWPWFGPVSDNVVRDFGFTLDEINWLGNIIACVYLPTAILTPVLTKRYGIRRTCHLATFVLLLSAWVRYAGTARSLPKQGAYALIIIGQGLSGFSQPVYQILAPKYSERWFDLKGRTTATMIVSIANPIGGGLGQLLSPSFSDTRTSILALAIISTVVVPITFLVLEAPPTPPSYSGSRTSSPSITSLFRAVIGQRSTPEAYMTVRERIDFAILASVFSALLASINTFSILSSQWLSPYGYSDDTSGLMGAALLLSGIVAAIASSPLFDRVLTHHLAITVRILCPLTGAAWLSLVWAVKANNGGALFTLFVIIGVCSISLLPVAIELGVELTRNPDGSSAVLWFFGNLLSISFILIQGALRADRLTGNPPLNMHRAIVFNGCLRHLPPRIFPSRPANAARTGRADEHAAVVAHLAPADGGRSTDNTVRAREVVFHHTLSFGAYVCLLYLPRSYRFLITINSRVSLRGIPLRWLSVASLLIFTLVCVPGYGAYM